MKNPATPARPVDFTRNAPKPAREERIQPNPGSVPEGGNSPLPQIDRHAGGPAKNSPATIGKPGGGGKSFKITGG